MSPDGQGSGALVTDHVEFWDLIDQARLAAGGDADRQAAELIKRLLGRSEGNLKTFAHFYETLRVRAYRHDLWCAAYLINGGMSDDGFSDFRDWLISRGREVYEGVLANPDFLADVADAREGEITAEPMGGAVYDAFEQTFGRDLPIAGPPQPYEPQGEHWDQVEEFRRWLPRIFAEVGHRYGWEDDEPPAST